MGTSTNYKAPKSPQWAALKGAITKLAHEGRPTSDTSRDIVRNYIQTNGGARRISRGGGTVGRSKAAQSVARRIGKFISSVSTLGFREAARQAGLEILEGQSTSEIIFALMDYLGGPSSTIDEVDARNALSRLVNELFEGAETQEDIERVLEENSSGEAFSHLLFTFFSYYLYEQFCRVFYERLTARVGQTQAETFLDGILDYIKSTLRHYTYDRDIRGIDWSSEQGKAIADEILEETLEVYGG